MFLMSVSIDEKKLRLGFGFMVFERLYQQYFIYIVAVSAIDGVPGVPGETHRPEASH